MQQSPAAARSRANRPPPRPVQVSQVRQITPHMVRVTVTGESLADFPAPAPASHFKVFFPDLDPTAERPINRTYTPRRWDPTTGALDIDFLIHGMGVASTWASQVQVGQRAAVGGPGGAYEIDSAADWLLIAGDDSALPGIATIVEALPPTMQARVFVEVEDADEEQELSSQARIDVTWLHRGTHGGPVGSLLAPALADCPLPTGSGKVWVACEASIMRSIKAHLLHERGLERERVYTHGYWKAGESNHPDHDLGKEIV